MNYSQGSRFHAKKKFGKYGQKNVENMQKMLKKPLENAKPKEFMILYL